MKPSRQPTTITTPQLMAQRGTNDGGTGGGVSGGTVQRTRNNCPSFARAFFARVRCTPRHALRFVINIARRFTAPWLENENQHRALTATGFFAHSLRPTTTAAARVSRLTDNPLVSIANLRNYVTIICLFARCRYTRAIIPVEHSDKLLTQLHVIFT